MMIIEYKFRDTTCKQVLTTNPAVKSGERRRMWEYKSAKMPCTIGFIINWKSNFQQQIEIKLISSTYAHANCWLLLSLEACQAGF